MNARSGQKAVGTLLALASCWPVHQGLAALADRDYLATALALLLAWVLGRTGVELIGIAEEEPPAPTARPVRQADDSGT